MRRVRADSSDWVQWKSNSHGLTLNTAYAVCSGSRVRVPGGAPKRLYGFLLCTNKVFVLRTLLTSGLTYVTDSERATVRRVCADSSDLVQWKSNSHGLTLNTAYAVCMMSLFPLRARQAA